MSLLQKGVHFVLILISLLILSSPFPLTTARTLTKGYWLPRPLSLRLDWRRYHDTGLFFFPLRSERKKIGRVTLEGGEGARMLYGHSISSSFCRNQQLQNLT